MTATGWLGQRYALRELLGHGGVSEVYRARDTRMRRYVAVKCLRSDLVDDAMLRERFRRRIEHTAALDHPAIVTVYEVGATDSGEHSFPFLAMEYVDGRALRRVLAGEGALRPQRALQITADLCAALQFAHRHGAAHGELGPGDVMIDRYGAVKVLNFEATTGVEQGLEGDTAPAYTTPAKVAADVYGAGCVLYEMVVGAPPDGEDPVPPSQRNPELGAALDPIVQTAVAQDPAQRYESAAAMRAAVVRALTGEPAASPAAGATPPEAGSTQVGTPGRAGTNGTGGAAALATTGMLATQPSEGHAQAAGTAASSGATAGATEHTSPPQGPVGGAAAPAATGTPRRRRRTPLVLLVLLGLVVAAGGIWWGTSGRGSQQPTPVALPELHGKSATAGAEQLRKLHLTTKRKPVYCQKGADGTPPPCQANQVGKVLRTAPSPGSKVRRNGTVTVYVAASAQQVSLPSELSGKTVQAATQRLHALGLQVAPQPQHTQVTDPAAAGKVTRTDPAAGARVDKGTVVTLTVGTKPPPTSSESPTPTKPPVERTTGHAKPNGKRGPNGEGTYVCTKSKLYFAACNRDKLGKVVPYPTYDHH